MNPDQAASVEIQYNTGRALEVLRGQRLRITGRTIVDFVALNAHDPNERFDQARTRSNQLKLFISTGDHLFSKDNNVMLTIVEDTWMWRHDLLIGTCSRKRIEMGFHNEVAQSAWGDTPSPRRWPRWEDLPPRGCWENLTAALEPWGVSSWDVPSPLNIFQNMRVDGESGKIWFNYQTPERDCFVEFEAAMDVVAAGSHCPSGIGHTTRMEVYWPGNRPGVVK